MGLFVCLLLAAADLTRVAGIEIVAPEDSVRFTQVWFICRILSGRYLEQPYSFVLCGPKKCLLLCSSMGHSGKMMIHCFDLYSLCFVRTVYWFVFPALRPIPSSVWTPPPLPIVSSSLHRFFFTQTELVADGVMFDDLRVPSLFFFAHEVILLSSVNS